MKNGILSGIRVIDCGTYIAGPASATVMSDFGAEVFKIERPDGGDLWRLFPHLPGTPKSKLNYAWILTGRNKKSVALDLASPEGHDALVRLVKTADVFGEVGENQPFVYRTQIVPGQMELFEQCSLIVGYARLR